MAELRALTFDEGLPAQEQEVTLGRTTYRVRARWNVRARVWIFSAWTIEGAPVFLGDAGHNGSMIGAGCLDWPDMMVVAEEVQKVEDLWNGKTRVVYVA